MNVKSISIVAALIASFGSTAALAADEYTLNQNLPTATVSAAPRVAVRVTAVDEYQGNQYAAAAAAVPAGLQRTGRDPARVATGGDHGVTCSKGRLGDIHAQAPACAGDEPNVFVVHAQCSLASFMSRFHRGMRILRLNRAQSRA